MADFRAFRVLRNARNDDLRLTFPVKCLLSGNLTLRGVRSGLRRAPLPVKAGHLAIVDRQIAGNASFECMVGPETSISQDGIKNIARRERKCRMEERDDFLTVPSRWTIDGQPVTSAKPALVTPRDKSMRVFSW